MWLRTMKARMKRTEMCNQVSMMVVRVGTTVCPLAVAVYWYLNKLLATWLKAMLNIMLTGTYHSVSCCAWATLANLHRGL